MPPPPDAEVIDLCLDDETPAKPPAPSRRRQVPKQSRRSIGDFVVLSDDTDSATNHQDEHHPPREDRPAKRRRTSVSPRQDDSLDPRLSTRTQGIDGPSRRNATGGARSHGSLQRTVTLSLDGSDPILCSSSPLHGGFQSIAAIQKEWEAEEVNTADGFDSWSENRADATGKVSSGGGYSERTLALLQELDGNASKNRSNQGQRKSTEEEKKREKKSGRDPNATVRKQGPGEWIELEDGEDDSQNGCRRPGPAKKPRMTGAEKAEEKARREQEKQQKLADKQAERERKLAVREAKVRERQAEADLAHANKSKMDKKLSTPEMIVDLPESLEETPVADQARSFLRNLGVEVACHRPPLKHVIKWRRKVTAEYSEARARWEPVAERITEEKHVMRVISARELVELIQAEQAAGDGDGDEQEGHDGDDRLDAHVSRLKRSFPGCRVIFLIEGLAAWMRKNKNVRNQAYRAAVMDGIPNDGGTLPEGSDTRVQARRRRKKKPQPQYIDEDVIEDALLRLQATHTCLIHHTASAVETAEWIANFTQHISTIPYK